MLDSELSTLLKKYDADTFDYTDYPHKSFWSEDKGDGEYREALRTFLSAEHKPITCYVHIPFCTHLCLYCICHKEITANYARVLDHFDNFLLKEIELFGRLCEERGLKPNFREIFLGGGSPTILKEPEIKKLVAVLATFIDITHLERFSIEVDPRSVSLQYLRFLKGLGITTVSLGIQDFDLSVQKAINRVQPPELVEALLPEIRHLFTSLNFDLLIGLPYQTPESEEMTVRRVIAMAPDRISLDYFRYAPNYYPHMKKLKAHLPGTTVNHRIFDRSVELLLSADYRRVGYKHFAKASDPVAVAHAKRTASFSTLGAISGSSPNVIAFGRSGHGTLGETYLFQNYYEQEKYASALADNHFPIYRGHQLSPDDRIRRALMLQLRTYFTIDLADIERTTGETFSEYFSQEAKELEKLAADGLIRLDGRQLAITEKGQHFTELILSVFDRYRRTQ